MPSSGGDVSSLFDDAARPPPFGVGATGGTTTGGTTAVAPHMSPPGVSLPFGAPPTDRPLHLQNHKARQVGLRKTSFCPLVVNACVTYWPDEKDSTLPGLSWWNLRPQRTFQSCFDPSVLKGISATSASAASRWDPRL